MYNYSDELYHYGVKGMKWGVRKSNTVISPKSISNKVKKARSLLDNAEKYQGMANTALQSSKGHRLLSAEAQNAGNIRKARMHERKSNDLLKTFEKLEEKSISMVGDFLKTKASALYDSTKIKDGAKHVESLAGLNISSINIDAYETKFKKDKRFVEGYNVEHQHLQSLTNRR